MSDDGENKVIKGKKKKKKKKKEKKKVNKVYQAPLRERMLNRWASLAMSTRVLEASPGKLDIKRHSPSMSHAVNSFSVMSGLVFLG